MDVKLNIVTSSITSVINPRRERVLSRLYEIVHSEQQANNNINR